MKRILVILFINTFVLWHLNAQETIVVAGKSMAGLQKLLHTAVVVPPLLNKTIYNTRPATLEEKLKSEKSNPQQVPLVYAYKHLALFCKIEVKLEQAVQLPVKVRLGSVDYVDWLEGKRDRY